MDMSPATARKCASKVVKDAMVSGLTRVHVAQDEYLKLITGKLRLMTRQQRSLKSIERLEQMQVRRINDIWEEVQAAVAEARGEILVVCAQIRR